MDNFFQPGQSAAVPGDTGYPKLPLLDAVSPSMRSVVTVIRELAHNSVPVLLIGEHGTGKQAVAHQIHLESGGAVEMFRVRSCRDLNSEPLALPAGPEIATLYLEEVGDITPEQQKKFSEILAKYGTNGSARSRIICGSSRDLDADVRTGSFREDLYYRLSGVCLRIPPLRQRREDIPQLVSFFLDRYASAYTCEVPVLSESTRRLFAEYSWPGNLPQLEAAIRTIVAVGSESVAMAGLRSMLTQGEGKANGDRVSLKEASRAASREAERELILKVLNRTRWNRRRAAQELQISYKALLYKLKQIGYGEYGAS